MELERDIDRRLAAMGVEVKPLQQMQQPAQLPASVGYRNPMGPKAPQIMWVGAGPAFLPPDGDYPGGSTGIDADGYLAFETGHGTQPYHGMYAPMQDAGIANRAPSTSLRQIRRGRARVLNKPLGLPKVGPPLHCASQALAAQVQHASSSPLFLPVLKCVCHGMQTGIQSGHNDF